MAVSVDPDRLGNLIDELETGMGWLLRQCGLPTTAATRDAAVVAELADAVELFAYRLDQEINQVATLAHATVTSLRNIEERYRALDATGD